MAPIKRKIYNSETPENSYKVWKQNPPGPEQKDLNRLFEAGMIDNSDTPNKVRLGVPLFHSFNPRTFALHFRTTKAKYGLNAANKTNEDDGDIPELYGTVNGPPTSQSSNTSNDSPIETRNFPHMVWTDHQAKHDVVCVAVPMITGCRDPKFVLSEDGMKLYVNCIWPVALLNPQELFQDAVLENGRPLPMSHPKVYSYQNRLSECDLSDRSRPEASLVIPLPLRVQREVGLGLSKRQGLTCGETKFAMLQFTAYQKNKVIEDADNSIVF